MATMEELYLLYTFTEIHIINTQLHTHMNTTIIYEICAVIYKDYGFE